MAQPDEKRSGTREDYKDVMEDRELRDDYVQGYRDEAFRDRTGNTQGYSYGSTMHNADDAPDQNLPYTTHSSPAQRTRHDEYRRIIRQYGDVYGQEPDDRDSPRGPHVGRGPKGYRRSDERVCEDICERLTQHGQIDASEIEVTVENGEVTLSGQVESRRVKRMAEDVADSVRGVRDVHNRLRVQTSDTH